MTQEHALEITKMGYNVFLTGSAGSGKTHVLSQYIQYLKEKNVVVGITASTGVAATHLGGITLNSWAGIGIKNTLTQNDLQELLQRQYLRKRFCNTQVLIIDEVSMLPDYSLDIVNILAQAFRSDKRPFGGMQIILCGDFFQLPPIAHDSDSHFVHKSQSWKQLDLKICYLEKDYRQADKEFLHILHEIRRNAVCKPAIKALANRIYKPLGNIATRLYTHNVNVDAINYKELTKLEGKLYSYDMEGTGNEFLIGVMQKSCLAPQKLLLKKGALVMFVKNNFDKGYVNGTLGTVIGFDKKGYPFIQTSSGKIVRVPKAEWVIEEDGQLKAQVKQLPLRLAWAITVHKSQGMSLDAAEIDLRNPFSPGMGYVALSRVRSLAGIRLMGLNHKALQVNPEILHFDKELRKSSEEMAKTVQNMQWFEKEVSARIFLQELQQEDN